MEMIEGIKSDHIEALDEQGYDRPLLAQQLVHSMFSQVLNYGFFHGDPHPGNIYIMPGNVISFIDFGMVGVMDDTLKFQFAKLIMELERGNTKGIIKSLDSMDILHDDTDMKKLQLNDFSAGAFDVEVLCSFCISWEIFFFHIGFAKHTFCLSDNDSTGCVACNVDSCSDHIQ